MNHPLFPRLVTRTVVVLAAVATAACGDAVGPSFIDSSGGEVSPVTNPARPSAEPSGNPLSGPPLWVPSWSRARITADQWRPSRPADAAIMDQLGAQPQAQWFNGWSTDVRSAVDKVVASATAAGAMPVLVAYNIPQRDCGSYSDGGSSSAEAYRSWITAFANGLAGRKAVVVMEPDALGGMGCLSSSDQQRRLELIRFGTQTLASKGALVYLDGGNNRWHTAATMASRLVGAGIEFATGFALNVSNFFTDAEEIAYGATISAAVGGKHYIIDTSRNGVGATADAQWCNPLGRAVGRRPTWNTGHALVDAFLWIKVPGESDGSCNGNPKSGTWMPEYALDLARRAGW